MQPAPLMSMDRIAPEAEEWKRIPRLEAWSLHSAFLPDPFFRQISVYLPEAYATEPDRRFPVFYLHDGQNVFDPHTSYIPGRTWRAGITADRMVAEEACEPVILIGVANTGVRRMAEYTPTRDGRLGGGDGALYKCLLVEELKPFVDQTYRTLPDCSNTGVGGSSLGGLISLYLGFEASATFGKAAVLSPSIWWDHRSILTLVGQAATPPRFRVWLDIGTGEGQKHVRDTELLHRLLLRAGWRDEMDVMLKVVADAVHDEDAWANRFGEVLRFLFPAHL